jgi:diguanylate cyclase
MFLKLLKKNGAPRPAPASAPDAAVNGKRPEFLLHAAQTLIANVGEFALDLRELPSAEFRNDLKVLSEKLAAEERLNQLERLFEDRSGGIVEFARRQKECLRTREAELKDIIDILTKAMAVLDGDNRDYTRSILEQGRRLEELSHLEDIRRLKQELMQEVEELRRAAREKEARDGEKIESLAQQVSILNHELQQARTESERDALTGVYNRRCFDRYLYELVEKNTAPDNDLALLMIDIDDFKRLNDTYGHLAGDSVLAAVARKCRQLIRSEDFMARYGGEEFVVVLPGSSLRNAVKKGRQICEAIASTRYLLEGSSSREPLNLSVSIGVSAWARADTAAALVERADKAMYRAKGAGKNCARSEKDET